MPDAEVVDPHLARHGGRGFRPVGGVECLPRGIKHRERLLGGREAVGDSVELGGCGAQGQVGLGGQDQHEQPGAQVEVPVDQA